jgi:hypothetical protein
MSRYLKKQQRAIELGLISPSVRPVAPRKSARKVEKPALARRGG